MNQYLSQDDCLSKLAKRMQNLRIDRPSEWMMDEFIRDADEMQLKIDCMKSLIIDLQATLRANFNSSSSMLSQCDEERKLLKI